MKKSFHTNEIKLNNGRIFVHKDFYNIEEVLKSFEHQANFQDKKKDFHIMQFWKEFIRKHVGDFIADNTFAYRFNKDRKLVIGVKAAAIANELQFVKAIIEKQFLDEAKCFDREVSGLVFELRS